MPLEFKLEKIDDLAIGFVDRAPFEVMKWTFSRFPQSQINTFTSEQLNNLLEELRQKPEVIALRTAIEAEINEHGREGLEAIGNMMAGFLPINSSQRVFGKVSVDSEHFDELAAICNNCEADFVKGNFERGTSLQNPNFRPGNVFYAGNLREIFDGNGRLIHQNCMGHDFRYVKRANVSIYRKTADYASQIDDAVRKIVQETADAMVSGSNRSKRYSTMERFLVERLGEFFPDIYQGKRINYPEMYKVFEWAYRQNLSLRQFGFNERLEQTLMESIGRFMIPVYGIITSRLKSLDRIFEKSLEVLYDSKRGEDVAREGQKKRILSDVYGIKIMVGSEEDCYKVKDAIVKAFGLVEPFDDSIRKARQRKDAADKEITNPSIYVKPAPAYRSLALKVKTGTANIEVQILTHEMDRINETSPNLAHGNSFEQEKRIRLAQFPWQTKAVVGVLIGHYG